MRPRLILDAHLSQVIADTLAPRGIDAIAAQQDPVLGKADDDALLNEACRLRRVLVTYNVQDFVPIAQRWAETGRHHYGIVLVHSRTIAQQDFGGQVRALAALLTPLSGEDALVDQTIYLAPATDRTTTG